MGLNSAAALEKSDSSLVNSSFVWSARGFSEGVVVEPDAKDWRKDVYRACLTGSVENGWKPCKAAWATCGSIVDVVVGAGADAGAGMVVVADVVAKEEWTPGVELVLPDAKFEAIR